MFARSLSMHADRRSVAARCLGLTVGLAVAVSAAFLLAAAPADAVVTGNFGFHRRAEPTVEAKPLQYHGGPVLHSSNSYAIYWDPTGTYRGDWQRLINKYFQDVGAQSGTLGDVFAVDSQYTDSTGRAANQSTFRGGYVDTNPYPTSENGGNCAEPATLSCLTDQQIQAELQRVIGSGALPGATAPPVYYILTPPGVTVCSDLGGSGNCSNSTASPPNGICGYHSAINPGSASPVVYAVQPWVAGNAGLLIEVAEPLKTSGTSADVLACQANKAPLEEPNQLPGLNPFGAYGEGLADVIINDLSIEQQNVVSDPLLNGWYQTATHAEQSDMCQWAFGPPPETPPTANPKTHAASVSNETINGHPYYVQWAFNSTWLTLSGKVYACWQGVSLEPHFTAPNPVNTGDVVGFDAQESLLTLQASNKGLPPDQPFTVPVYKWNFGDGTVVSGPNAASQFHAYTYSGTYNVTLTVTDSGANVGTFTEPITVVGTPPPSQTAQGSTPSGQAGQSGTSATPGAGAGAGGATTGTAAKSGPTPVATASVVSRSLRSVLGKGLVVRYSINERVTGHFDVLLARSIARRIGVRGPTAGGLATGTPPQTIIGKAILVTSAGGHSTVKIQFGKKTASRLRRLSKVSLMLRLVVRNGSTGTTTVLSTVTLSR